MRKKLKNSGSVINVTSNTIDELLSHLRIYFQKNSFSRKDADEKPPLRSELFTEEQMQQHAEYLSALHQLNYVQGPEQLLKRLSENEEVLVRVINLLQEAVKEKNRISPAGEWLLDNFYLIEEQILTGKRYLPKGYSKGLPKLFNTASAGLPRVYDIALEIISHSDGRVDIKSLSGFIAAYQKTSHLTIGELWAVPIMLRLALLENLRRVAARTALDRIDEKLANYWAEKIITGAEKNRKNLVLIIADMARANPPMVSAFVAPFTQKLQWKGSEVSLALNWLEQHLADKGFTITSLLQAENQKQAAYQVSMSNSINSLRFLAKMDWREFVETMSVVEQTLRQDVGGIYPRMDFNTRDSYRHAVEKIAKKSTLSENEVAGIAVKLAEESASEKETGARKAHLGYYLIGKGIRQTEKIAKVKLTAGQTIKKIIHRNKQIIYIFFSLFLTLGVAFVLFLKAYDDGPGKKLAVFLALLLLLCSSHLALALSNWLATLLVKPKQLPRMNFCSGIPNNERTLVVVPCMLSNALQVKSLLEELEVRFLANRDKNLLFGLLTDFKDAKTQFLSEDEELVSIAKKGIEDLNKKYLRPGDDTFYLFHRPRRWNEKDKIWMGWERKRGKLTDLNYLLRSNGDDRFSVIVGAEQLYKSVKYVITLDADTQLPREAAWKLVGMMAHPLNQALYSEKKKRIIEGYSIIQPRIAISLHGAVRSWYTRMHENDSGIDPYTRVTSDVYQDLFEEGSFIGKGIYEVDVFAKVLNKRFPENRILSHDLLEGAYARCAFASDVQLYEEYPSSYSTDMNRRHRWIRGDWQIGNWFLPFVPDLKGRLHRNPVSALSRWKIFDNLRRSLIPPALLILLVLGWTILHNAWFWTLCVSGIVVFPSLAISAWNILKRPDDVIFKHHIENSIEAIYRNILYAAFTVICLPYEAFISLDAIMRTAWRMLITQRKMLEWNPSGFDQINQYKNLFSVYLHIWFAPFVSVALFVYMILFSPLTLLVALPFLIVWSLSPAIVWWLSRPLLPVKTKLNAKQIIFLQKLSRKTWAFFESFVGPEDNWLPPDNFQQHPIAVIAHRTSPTNMGLSLLANLSAWDFGYSNTSQLIERTANIFQNMKKLERYCGHFYNWYDTKTLKALYPKYISTVDSGNLAGHLLTLKQGLLAVSGEKIAGKKIFEGLHDTVMVMTEKLKAAGVHAFEEFQSGFEAVLNTEPISAEDIKNKLEKISALFNTEFSSLNIDPANAINFWTEKLTQQIKNALYEISILSPWYSLLSIPGKFKDIKIFKEIPSLNELAVMRESLENEIAGINITDNTSEENEWLKNFKGNIDKVSLLAGEKINTLRNLANICDDFADMEYDFLYDKSQHLLSIGYNVEDHRRDSGFYDLLASEARLASFVAIAQGKIPQDNWFALGRRLTNAAGTSVLISWSGSMFEYLMPNLVMPSYENTLLDQTNIGVIKKQIEYGRLQNAPWGISESCYNMVDANLNYQYRAFGVPGLGFKRGLGEDLVIAPYASVMALMIDPEAAYQNLVKLATDGYEGKYGFFESIDYTPSRLPRGKSHIVIQTFMVHHQGMSLLSLVYLLMNQPMQKRFEAEPRFQATLLLLQEQIPKATGFYTNTADITDVNPVSPVSEIRVIKSSDTQIPEVQLLSNGKYHVMITNAGGGYSRWNEYAITRWREDSTCDNWGSFCYIRDLDTGQFWSTAHHPTLKKAKTYEAVFSQGRAEFRRLDNDIETHTEIIVSPEDNIEIRRVQITNRTSEKKEIEVTSYAEVVLAPPSSDAAHPAFSNLFIQTEILSNNHAILCTRRPRSKEEKQPWMFHMMKATGAGINQVSYETDREKFIGRGNSTVHPRVMKKAGILSGSQGSVIDPIVSVRYTILLNEDETATVDIIFGIEETKNACQGLIDKYQDRHLRDRAFELSWTHNQVILRQINASETDAQLYGKIAGSVIYSNPNMRAAENILIKNHRGQSALWSYSISGDLPIILLQISDPENMPLVKQLIQARAYWQLKGLVADLIIWNEDQSGYRQVLQDEIQNLVEAGRGMLASGMEGGIVMRSADQISQEDRVLLQTVARIIITDTNGNIEEQLNKKNVAKKIVPLLIPSQVQLPADEKQLPQPELNFFNGSGGFSPDGKEYVIITTPEQTTPAPWANVIANPNFGTLISENGSAYTWFENAHEFRLTPWSNDPVVDCGGEAFYIRDEKNGASWSPLPFPVRGKSSYITKHGFGYSSFEHIENGIKTEAIIYTDIESPVKFTVIKIRNNSGKLRQLSLTGYAEWILADLHSKSLMHIVTGLSLNGAVTAKNPYHPEFTNYVAFFDTDNYNSFTTDRAEFIGRNNNLQNPESMKRAGFSGKYGAGYDPCAAMQLVFDLEDDTEKEIIFRIGASADINEAEKIITRFKGSKPAAEALGKVHRFWQRTLTQIIIDTPEQSLNILANGWLLYQVISCRLWGRSGFYQSGGAFGFRDQLQDVMALMYTEPAFARKQILLAASRQFIQGDVQHWWHPPLGKGVRTHCSDDFLWLPFVTMHYCTITGDTNILAEEIAFIEGRPVNADEESYYDLPILSETKTNLYDHCKRAVKQGLRFGAHGLPLIGSGDWNDGMNLVGKDGKGESSWLGFFLYDILKDFENISRRQNDADFALECKQQAEQLRKNLHANAWDGNWYLRGYFDDGSPLGSAKKEECKIDSISQSWSVISGAGDARRMKMALDSVNKYLVHRDYKIIQLLNPPFDTSAPDPGYIKGYAPGVRENGGQYTHAAIWAVMAFAITGQKELTWEMLQMINPVNHGRSADAIAVYKTEPYIMAADIYAVDPQAGRGGWTWYTGSAGWMYQLITQSFLGLKKEGNKLSFNPCVPNEWHSFTLQYRHLNTIYLIIVELNGHSGKLDLNVDGAEQQGEFIYLKDDGKEHKVTIKTNAMNMNQNKLINTNR